MSKKKKTAPKPAPAAPEPEPAPQAEPAPEPVAEPLAEPAPAPQEAEIPAEGNNIASAEDRAFADTPNPNRQPAIEKTFRSPPDEHTVNTGVA